MSCFAFVHLDPNPSIGHPSDGPLRPTDRRVDGGDRRLHHGGGPGEGGGTVLANTVLPGIRFGVSSLRLFL